MSGFRLLRHGRAERRLDSLARALRLHIVSGFVLLDLRHLAGRAVVRLCGLVCAGLLLGILFRLFLGLFICLRLLD